MRLFSRPKQPALENKVMPPPEENKIEQPPEPIVQLVPAYVCVACGNPANPEHRFTNGDLYLKRLEHNYLCDACHEEREKRRERHPTAIRKTHLETPTVQVEH